MSVYNLFNEIFFSYSQFINKCSLIILLNCIYGFISEMVLLTYIKIATINEHRKY
jgi:hypothetical protein